MPCAMRCDAYLGFAGAARLDWARIWAARGGSSAEWCAGGPKDRLRCPADTVRGSWRCSQSVFSHRTPFSGDKPNLLPLHDEAKLFHERTTWLSIREEHVDIS